MRMVIVMMKMEIQYQVPAAAGTNKNYINTYMWWWYYFYDSF